MEVKVTGAQELTAAFIASGSDAAKYAALGLSEEAYEVFYLSQVFVPVRTGALKTSGTVHEPKVSGSQVTVEITYGGPGTEYAALVHELPPDMARHVPPTRWKYLEFPMKMLEKGREQRLAKRIQDMVNSRFNSIT